MSNGWIKLHRKLMEKGFYRNSQYVHLWVHLLLLANHKEKEFMFNDKIIVIKEGQLITGRKELSKATGIAESTIERILNMLENEHQIGQQKTTKYRLITVLNWDEHQNRTSERTASGQQADTNKNVKNEENNTSADERREVRDDSEEEKTLKKPAKYPNAKKIFALWGAYPKHWDRQTTFLLAAEEFYNDPGLGFDEAEYIINTWYPKNKDREFCPQIHNPHDLLTKYPKIEAFSHKQHD